MKKWLSLVLCIFILTGAVSALGEGPEFCSGLKEWADAFDPSANDYLGTFYLQEDPIGRGVLRADESITELNLQLPLPPKADDQQDYADLAVIQYADNGLAVSALVQTWLVDIDSILAWLRQDQSYDLKALENDLLLIRSMTLKAILNLLQPDVTVNKENGALLIRIAVTEKDIAARMPAFLDSLTPNEKEVDKLLLKASSFLITIQPDFPLSLAALKEYWAAKASDESRPVPPFALEAEAVVTLPSGDTPLQIGLSGFMYLREDFTQFSMEYLPGEGNSFILSGNLNGNFGEQVFDHDLIVQKQSRSLEATLSQSDKSHQLLELRSFWDKNWVYASLARTEGSLCEQIDLNASRQPDTGDVSFNLEKISYNPLDPTEETVSKNIISLNASVQRGGTTGVLTVLEDATVRFTLTGGKLYYRGNLQIAKGNDVIDLDAWILSEGNRSWRYRVTTMANHGERYLLSGTVNPSHLDLSLQPALGKDVLTMSLDTESESGLRTITGNLNADTSIGNIAANGTLQLKDGLPVFLNGAAYITGNESEEVYTLAWMPGKLSFVDNANHYELTRTEDRKSKISYVLVRNKQVTLGSFSAEISQDNAITAAVYEGENSNPIASFNLIPCPAKSPEVSVEPEGIGSFTGQVTEDGTISGTLSAPESPEAEPRIIPLDTTNAIRINLNAFLQLLYGSVSEAPQAEIPEAFPLP